MLSRALAFVVCRLGSIMRRPKANPIGARTLSLWMKTRSVLILTIWGESLLIYVLLGLLFLLVLLCADVQKTLPLLTFLLTIVERLLCSIGDMLETANPPFRHPTVDFPSTNSWEVG